MSDAFWTNLRVRSLRNLWAGEHRAQVIAETIGDGCTRNMVIGKANRLGLPARTKQQSAKAISDSWIAFMRTSGGQRWRKWKAHDMERLWQTPNFRRKVRVGKRPRRMTSTILTMSNGKGIER